jgi:hypothetical protein
MDLSPTVFYISLGTIATLSFAYCTIRLKNGEAGLRFIIAFIAGVASLFAIASNATANTDGNLERGRQLLTECKLIEINIADNTSRFSCKDVGLVLKTSDAKRFVEAYKKSLTEQ